MKKAVRRPGAGITRGEAAAMPAQPPRPVAQYDNNKTRQEGRPPGAFLIAHPNPTKRIQAPP